MYSPASPSDGASPIIDIDTLSEEDAMDFLRSRWSCAAQHGPAQNHRLTPQRMYAQPTGDQKTAQPGGQASGFAVFEL